MMLRKLLALATVLHVDWFLWRLYTWFYNLLFMGMEVLPMFVRNLIFKVLFYHIGHINLIDYKTYFRYPSKIKIGENVSINRGCMFLASGRSETTVDIEIGDNVVFSPNVKLLSAGHDHCFMNLPDTFGKITIGDNVWIGEGTIVLEGVTIGTGAVIGAGSVVPKDVDPWTVVAGNPVRKIKDRDILS